MLVLCYGSVVLQLEGLRLQAYVELHIVFHSCCDSIVLRLYWVKFVLCCTGVVLVFYA